MFRFALRSFATRTAKAKRRQVFDLTAGSPPAREQHSRQNDLGPALPGPGRALKLVEEAELATNIL